MNIYPTMRSQKVIVFCDAISLACFTYIFTFSSADFFDEGPSVDLEFAIRNRTQKYLQSSSLKKRTKNHLFLMDHEDMPFTECHGNNAQFKDQQNDAKFVHLTDYSFQSWDDSLAKGTSSVNQRNDCHLWTSNNNFLAEDYCLENRFTASGRSNCHVNNNSISSKLGNASLRLIVVWPIEQIAVFFLLIIMNFAVTHSLGRISAKHFCKVAPLKESGHLTGSWLKARKELNHQLIALRPKRSRFAQMKGSICWKLISVNRHLITFQGPCRRMENYVLESIPNL